MSVAITARGDDERLFQENMEFPMTPRLMSDQKPSIVFVWTAPTTYSWAAWRTTACG
jgi:hypothetical protein